MTHVKRVKKFGEYTYYIGKIPNRNVITDGTYFAHCKDVKSGIADLLFKTQRNRDIEQYKQLNHDSVLSTQECIACHRLITGACQAGVEQFVGSIEDLKDSYTIGEVIELTSGQFVYYSFVKFFE